jgi:hypothetical protein
LEQKENEKPEEKKLKNKKSLKSQLELCKPGDLVCCIWTDASIGKTSTNGGAIDIPAQSWGIYIGVFGKKKHIILAQNSFEYSDGLCDLDYTAIPLGWTENVQIIVSSYIPLSAGYNLVNSFVRCDSKQNKTVMRNNRARTLFQRRFSTHGRVY